MPHHVETGIHRGPDGYTALVIQAGQELVSLARNVSPYTQLLEPRTA